MLLTLLDIPLILPTIAEFTKLAPNTLLKTEPTLFPAPSRPFNAPFNLPIPAVAPFSLRLTSILTLPSAIYLPPFFLNFNRR